MNLIHSWDIQILEWVNTVAVHPWLDVFFKNVTDLHKQPAFALAAMLAVIGAAGWRYRWRAWRVVLAMVIAVGCSDLFCYRILKASVERPRPFASAELSGKVRQLAEAHGNSFPSNHSANCFAAAVVLSFAFPAGTYFFYTFGAIVAYSRVYLGVHYPSDVLAGAIVGCIIGWVVSAFTVFQLKNYTRTEN